MESEGLEMVDIMEAIEKKAEEQNKRINTKGIKSLIVFDVRGYEPYFMPLKKYNVTNTATNARYEAAMLLRANPESLGFISNDARITVNINEYLNGTYVIVPSDASDG